MTEDEVRQELERECRRAGSKAAWAARAGCSPQYVTDVVLGRRAPGELVLAGLGLERVVSYRRRKA